MSRAKDQGIVQLSQKVFKVIAVVGLIVIGIIVIFMAKSIIATKYHDATMITSIMNEQKEKAEEEKMGHDRRRIEKLKEKSAKAILSEKEIDELKYRSRHIDETRKAIDAEYQLEPPGQLTTFPQQTEKLHLPVCNKDGCEEVPTAYTEPGIKHKVWSSGPYRVISEKPEGGRELYSMSAGWDTLTGTEPSGKIRMTNVKGSKKEVLVKLIRVR